MIEEEHLHKYEDEDLVELEDELDDDFGDD